jgi:hypothetical protein
VEDFPIQTVKKRSPTPNRRPKAIFSTTAFETLEKSVTQGGYIACSYLNHRPSFQDSVYPNSFSNLDNSLTSHSISLPGMSGGVYSLPTRHSSSDKPPPLQKKYALASLLVNWKLNGVLEGMYNVSPTARRVLEPPVVKSTYPSETYTQ